MTDDPVATETEETPLTPEQRYAKRLKAAIERLNGGQLLWEPQQNYVSILGTPPLIYTEIHAGHMLYGIERAEPYGPGLRLFCRWHAYPVLHPKAGWRWVFGQYYANELPLLNVDAYGGFTFIGCGLSTAGSRGIWRLFPRAGGIVEPHRLDNIPGVLKDTFRELGHLAPTL